MQRIAFPGFILASLAAVLWGSAGTAQTFITSDTLTPLWVGALRLICACLFFYPVLYLNAQQSSGGQFSDKKGGYFIKVLAAGVCMAMFNLLFFTGVKIAGVALGSCVIIASAPVWAGILEAVIKHKAPDALWLIGVAVAISGGIWMAFSQADAFSVAGVIALGAALVFAQCPDFYIADVLIVIYLGVIVTGIAYLLYGAALKTTRVSTCVALGLLEPVTAFILAIVIVGENVNPWATVGLIAILAGLALVLKSEQKGHHAES